MKVRMLSAMILFAAASWQQEIRAEELPDVLKEVLRTDTAFQSVSCRIDIELDVPGFEMPEKEIELTLEKGKKPRIESKGITILPKHGIIGQYREFLELDCQAIPISENGDTLVYKLVSLDRKSDWTTVDMAVTQSDAKVHSMLISTRKNGEYQVRHTYGPDNDLFPELTEISFEAVPLKLPLKFMGKQEGIYSVSDQEGPVTGKILLRYSKVSWTKSSD
jgi:hypothetical protein